jgi:ribose-phosphate pyrophosphokinase
MNIIGEVEGRTCVIMDDLVDTAGTLCKAATALKEHGASRSSPTASTRYSRAMPSSGSMLPISTNWSSPTPFRCARMRKSPRIRQLSVAEVMAETIRRISNEDSVSSLFIE